MSGKASKLPPRFEHSQPVRLVDESPLVIGLTTCPDPIVPSEVAGCFERFNSVFVGSSKSGITGLCLRRLDPSSGPL